MTFTESVASVGNWRAGQSLDDDFQLSDCLSTLPMTTGTLGNDHGQGARELVQLLFDEDADTMGGSQDRDVLFGGDSDLDDVDLWVSDEAESFRAISPLLDVVDDTWGSSQSTLDVCFSSVSVRMSMTVSPPGYVLR